AERAHLVHDLAIELLVPVGLDDARHQFVLAVVARSIADRDLLLGELIVEEERVLPVERLGVGGDASGGALHRNGGCHGCSCRSFGGSYQPAPVAPTRAGEKDCRPTRTSRRRPRLIAW